MQTKLFYQLNLKNDCTCKNELTKREMFACFKNLIKVL